MTPEIPAFRFGSRLEIEYRDMAIMLSWPLITPWWSRLHAFYHSEQTTPPAGVDQHTRAWCPACSEQATAATWWVLKRININYRKHICSLSVWFCGCSSSPVNCMGRMQQALRAYSAAWQPCRGLNDFHRRWHARWWWYCLMVYLVHGQICKLNWQHAQHCSVLYNNCWIKNQLVNCPPQLACSFHWTLPGWNCHFLFPEFAKPCSVVAAAVNRTAHSLLMTVLKFPCEKHWPSIIANLHHLPFLPSHNATTYKFLRVGLSYKMSKCIAFNGNPECFMHRLQIANLNARKC